MGALQDGNYLNTLCKEKFNCLPNFKYSTEGIYHNCLIETIKNKPIYEAKNQETKKKAKELAIKEAILLLEEMSDEPKVGHEMKVQNTKMSKVSIKDFINDNNKTTNNIDTNSNNNIFLEKKRNPTDNSEDYHNINNKKSKCDDILLNSISPSKSIYFIKIKIGVVSNDEISNLSSSDKPLFNFKNNEEEGI